jgi:hypothetical protein
MLNHQKWATFRPHFENNKQLIINYLKNKNLILASFGCLVGYKLLILCLVFTASCGEASLNPIQ